VIADADPRDGGLPDPVRYWARRAPRRPALRDANQSWTWAELDDVVSEAARALFRSGLEPGAPVALEVHDPLAVATLLHALHRLGAVVVPVGPRLTEEEAERVRREAGVVERVRGLTLEVETTGDGGTAARQADFQRRPGDPAAICFTSGTTDRPRGVVLTHGNLYASARASAVNLGVREEDIWLACMPLHHVGGLSILARGAWYGSAVLLHSGFDAPAVNDALDRDGVTLLSLVPPMLERLLRARGGRPFPQTVRAALIGGGPCPAALLEEAAGLGLRALPTYGLTEAAAQVATLPPGEWPRGLETAGRPLPGIDVEVRGEDGRALGPGVEGTIAVRGPVVMAGYVDDRREGRDSLAEGWLVTGDTGAWDGEGRLLVLDRRVDRIVAGGETIAPAEVEAVLRAHPAVADACVVGLPTPSWGHEIAVAVVLREGASVTLEELRAFGGAKLSRIKLPRRLRIVEALPRTASGKLLRRAVRDGFGDEVA
jgi:O-succinylbenzoic acid--CoA ligase